MPHYQHCWRVSQSRLLVAGFTFPLAPAFIIKASTTSLARYGCQFTCLHTFGANLALPLNLIVAFSGYWGKARLSAELSI